ncbi:MAG: hypothetical protein QXL15_00635 [Candidatus Korarchaeota archaeon]
MSKSDAEKTAKRIHERTDDMARSGILTKIMSIIPGYHGYKNKEVRREDDAALRKYMTKEIVHVKQMLDRLYQMVIDYNITQTWETMDKIVNKVERIRARVEHADYGYGGFFSAQKIKEKELDRMYEFDAAMLDKINEIKSFVEEFQLEMDKGNFDKAWEYVYRTLRLLDEFDRTWDGRKDYMLKYTESVE